MSDDRLAEIKQRYSHAAPDSDAGWLIAEVTMLRGVVTAQDDQVARLREAVTATETENANLAMRVNAVTEVLNGIVIASRPGTPKAQVERAWKLAGTMLAIRDARAAVTGGE